MMLPRPGRTKATSPSLIGSPCPSVAVSATASSVAAAEWKSVTGAAVNPEKNASTFDWPAGATGAGASRGNERPSTAIAPSDTAEAEWTIPAASTAATTRPRAPYRFIVDRSFFGSSSLQRWASLSYLAVAARACALSTAARRGRVAMRNGSGGPVSAPRCPPTPGPSCIGGNPNERNNMRKLSAFLTLVALAVIAATASPQSARAAGADWAMGGHDFANSHSQGSEKTIGVGNVGRLALK